MPLFFLMEVQCCLLENFCALLQLCRDSVLLKTFGSSCLKWMHLKFTSF